MTTYSAVLENHDIAGSCIEGPSKPLRPTQPLREELATICISAFEYTSILEDSNRFIDQFVDCRGRDLGSVQAYDDRIGQRVGHVTVGPRIGQGREDGRSVAA